MHPILLTWFDGLYADEDHLIADGLWGISTYLGRQGVDWEYADNAKNTYRMLSGDNNTDLVAGFSDGLFLVWPKVIASDEATYSQYKLQSANKKIFDTVDVRDSFDAKNLTFTDEESDIVSAYLVDIKSFDELAFVKFVTNEPGYDIDNDDDWNAYIKQLNDMHLEDVTNAYQAAYDRYLEDMAALAK